MKKTAIVLCVFWEFSGFGCQGNSIEQRDCGSVEAAITTFETMSGDLAEILTSAGTPSESIKKLQAYMDANARRIKACTARLDEGFKGISADAVVKYHESFVSNAAVAKFLDAQDHFQETATAEQNEALTDLVSLLPFFSE